MVCIAACCNLVLQVHRALPLTGHLHQQNHGQIAIGKNLDSAFELAQEVENICHQYINAIRIGIPKLLSKREMKIVLDKMKNYKKD